MKKLLAMMVLGLSVSVSAFAACDVTDNPDGKGKGCDNTTIQAACADSNFDSQFCTENCTADANQNYTCKCNEDPNTKQCPVSVPVNNQ